MDFKALKAYMEIQLEDYNLTPGVVPMNLVLFRDAIEHGESMATTQSTKGRHLGLPLCGLEVTDLQAVILKISPLCS